MRIVRDARRVTAWALGTYGRTVVGIAELIAPSPRPAAVAATPVRPVVPRSAPASVPVVAAADADLATLRRAALDAVLGAAVDPARSAAHRFGERVTGVSDWTAGRLLADTERLRRAAVEVSRSVTDSDGLVHQRRFAAALRREFPWLGDDAAYALWDHAVLLTRRAESSPAVALVPPPSAERPGVGGLLRRLAGR